MRLRSTLLALSALAACTAIVGCSTPTRRSGFEEAPKEGTGFDDGTGTSLDPTTPSDEGPACATAEAEAVPSPVDIILSVDQSGSMSDDIANVKANINKLSGFLDSTGLDYRVVMIGTVGNGTYDICVPPPLGGAGCASNGNILRTVNRNVQSTDTLDIILETLNAASGPTAWKDFLRKDSVKVFIPVTDDNSWSPAASFDSSLLATGLFGTAKDRHYVFYPITGAAAYPSTSTCGSNAVDNGQVYLDLAKLTNGQWFPICSTNFAPVFTAIGKNIADTVACELPLPKPKDGATLDYGRVNVSVTDAKGESKEILQDSKKACDSANGWQYSADRTKVLLCGSACAAVKKSTGSKVSVTFGCQTKVM